MNSECEEWRVVVGFPAYEVSSLGRVRSHKFSVTRVLSTSFNRDGYVRVRFYEGNHQIYRFVHRIVAEAFIGPRPAGMEIRHRDDDKLNNTAANICYGTRSENILDAVRNGKQHQSSKTHCPQNHPYDAENTIVRKNGWRHCRACDHARQARWRAQQRTKKTAGTA